MGYLLVESDLLKAAGNNAQYAEGDDILLCNDGVMYLFFSIKYETGGQEIESVNNSGVVGVILGMAQFTYKYALGTGQPTCKFIITCKL